ncbi:hypothetical protein [Klebsiella aerogenes]|uniref:hypothetical protein n=1 Tax=Klebsiella aerogenes TaxID=548 RepID=UPI0013A61E57|nr:hypothetical protein [Klebsiella aerogenes]HCB2860413.1 hypothetical protein [Klebsiella aerogenes]HCB2865898.1 hypothetical protein [Klebsiella aerogenes]HCB2881451.1 hypothetical protein [Klebsiella aerogenes]HCB3346393.1 hypothetical protein [Klebsiella aerogenes]HCM1812481.1 hypothetical protein [Klebsiella aerogenes]
MGANTIGQLTSDDPFSYQSLLLSGVGGWKSAGAGYWTTVGISTGTAYLDSSMAGNDPTYAVAGAAFGASLGYGVANKFEKVLTQNEIKKKMGISMSKNAFSYFDEPVKPGSYISKGMELSPYPGISGGVMGAGFSEGGSRAASSLITPKSEGDK